jgi:hypothetical protein
LHTHFASPEAPNVVFVQDAPDLTTLEQQIRRITEDSGFQQWTKKSLTTAASIAHSRNPSGGGRRRCIKRAV